MRLNKYTITIKNGKKTILYNLITKTLIQIPISFDKVKDYVVNLSENDIQFSFLYDHLIISRDDNNDYDEMISIKEMHNNQTDIGRFMVHLGYSCNLNCIYCYQKGTVEDNVSVNVSEIILFISKRILDNSYNVIDLCFIGGEPLLYLEQIKQIASFLKNNYRGKVIYSVITNGVLLNLNTIDALCSYGIRDYLVTIDGEKDVHDELRKKTNGEGSFQSIIDNMIILAKRRKDINITLNYNISSVNVYGVESFIQYLKKTEIEYPLSFSMVFDNGFNKQLGLVKQNRVWLGVHKIALKYGYHFEPMYRELYLGCAMTQKNYHIIGADGNLYKCINGVGNKRYYLSSVSDYGCKKYNQKLEFFMNYEIDRVECKKCELYPVCYGGCEYLNHLRGFNCEKRNFYENDIELIREIVNATDKSY